MVGSSSKFWVLVQVPLRPGSGCPLAQLTSAPSCGLLCLSIFCNHNHPYSTLYLWSGIPHCGSSVAVSTSPLVVIHSDLSRDQLVQLPLTPAGLQLHHPDYGGVISGSWRFWSSDELICPPRPLVEGRTLFHVIDCAGKVDNYSVCSPPQWASTGITKWVDTPQSVLWVDDSNTVLDGWGLLPADDVACVIQCPLVYSTTHWAVCSLTTKELLVAFDLSEALVPSMTQLDSLPFIQSAPGRLLGALLKTIDHSAQPEQRQVDTGSKINQVCDEAPIWPKVLGADWVGVLESTTKADDAQAHTGLWDQRVFSRVTVHIERVREFHQRFGTPCLDVIRDFLLRS
jgi:hypothetical protein